MALPDALGHAWLGISGSHEELERMSDAGDSGGPDLQPGQIWLIERPVAGGSPALDNGALAGADVVLYDCGLASLITDLLPRGSYAEPLPTAIDEDAPAISARALRLALDGWSVVQLVQTCRSWRRRLRVVADKSGWPAGSGNLTIQLIAKTSRSTRSRDARLRELRELIDGSADDELLTLIVGPLPAQPSAGTYAVAANGLAG
jgi:hypothetical protein